jgi:hypothetical protein
MRNAVLPVAEGDVQPGDSHQSKLTDDTRDPPIGR